MFGAIFYLGLLCVLAFAGFLLGYLMWGFFNKEDLASRIAELRHGLFQDNPLAQDMRDRLEESRQLILARTGDLTDLRKSTGEREQAYVALERRMAQATTSLAVFDAEVGDLRSSLKEHDQLAGEIERKLAAAEAATAEKAGAAEKLRRELADKDLRTVDLERRLGAAEKAAGARAEERKLLDGEATRLRKEHDKGVKELAALQRAEQEKGELLERERDAVDKLRANQTELGQGLASKQQEIERLQSLMDGLRNELQQLRQKEEDLEAKKGQSEEVDSEIRSRSDAIRGEIAKLTPQLSSLTKDHSEVVASLDTAEAEAGASGRRADRHDEQRAALGQQLSELRVRLDGLAQRSRRAKQASDDGKRRVHSLEPDVARLKSKNDSLQAELDRLHRDMAKDDAELANLGRSADEMESAVARGDGYNSLQSETSGLRRELEALELRQSDRENRLNMLHINHSELRAAAHQTEGEADAVVGQAEQVEDEAGQLVTEVQERTELARNYATIVEGLELRVRSSESKTRYLQDRLRALDAHLTTLSSEEMEARRALRESQADMELERERNAWLDARIQDGKLGEQVVRTRTVTTIQRPKNSSER